MYIKWKSVLHLAEASLSGLQGPLRANRMHRVLADMVGHTVKGMAKICILDLFSIAV